MRFVLDTNIIIAALRSPKGASSLLLQKALKREYEVILNVPLVLEYEAIASKPEHRIVSGLTSNQVEAVISALCAVGRPVESHFLWRPQLRDPADEMVLEAGINGNANAIVTFNKRDFEKCIKQFDISIISPQDALRRLKS